ncbi:hypothetical protein Q4E93_19865 [Flavitalea sp. BT771]|uniref:OB-fold protein n=1 Tax=Flavitalea sp. BT771 TaxID=3063329 RepID=UPI0026E1D5CB|nr:hypothetical protein [Flavitalea sp. BT771]MDO6432875.1 hypothetical protein [Flavitalea sp. BT771]MDV6221849.1 hypothetical protein [Flavitalea sp. BT771]
MSIKKLLLITLAAGISLAVIYGYKEYHRTNKDLSGAAPDYQVRDKELIHAFLADEPAAARKYTGKLVAVEGIIRERSADGTGHYTVALGGNTGAAAIRCSIDSTHGEDIALMDTGRSIILKGLLIGFSRDETGILGSEVQLVRCVRVPTGGTPNH